MRAHVLRGSLVAFFSCLALLTGCGAIDDMTDAGRDAGSMGTLDAGRDAGTMDAGIDAGPMDAGPMDSGVDAGPMDAGVDAGPVVVKVIGFNDFHGNLAVPSGSNAFINVARSADGGNGSPVSVGGAEAMAQVIAELKAQNPNNVVVSAGDLIGGSPLVSKGFYDEPTVAVMNAMGLDIAGIGNHEFDEGLEELLRLQAGVCRPEGCFDAGVAFQMPRFQFVGANVRRVDGGAPLPEVVVRTFQGVRVAFIGLTLESTPSILAPKGRVGITFQNELAAIDRLVPTLTAQGIRAVVVVLHQGGFQASPTGLFALFDSCENGLTGDGILPILRNLNREVDLVVSGHTHAAYNCECPFDGGACSRPTDGTIRGRRITSAAAFGRLISDIDLSIDRGTGDVVAITQANRISFPLLADGGLADGGVAAAATQTVRSLVNTFNTTSASVRLRPVGRISATISSSAGEAGQIPLGLLIADAQLRATLDAGAVAAFMNSGGVRAPLTFRDAGAGNPSIVTYEDLFNAQPFGNLLVTLTLTGNQLLTFLQQQFADPTRPTGRILQVSRGFSFSYTADGGAGPGTMRVDTSSVRLNGMPIDPLATYRVTVNNFMAGGGDSYTALTMGTDSVVGDVDIDALENFFRDAGVVDPPALDRIIRTP